MSAAQPTPLMQQYDEIKARHRDAILLFRMGDFFEMFHDDARVAARVLGLTLTSRNNGGAAAVPLAGVPVRAANEYVRRLVEQGYRVAVCDQIEDPRAAKGIVKRAVIETVTPGAVFADDLLDSGRNTFLAAIQERGDAVGIAAADLSTGEFRLVAASRDDAAAALARLAPRELLVTATMRSGHPASDGTLVTERDAWEFDPVSAARDLAEHYGVVSLEGLGLGPGDDLVVGAAGALVRYLRELQPAGIAHLSRPVIERPGGLMPLDDMTRRNLELVESMRGAADGGTLLSVLDRTVTPMGARLLRARVLAPLTERTAIEDRLDAVAALAGATTARDTTRVALDGVRDIERLAAKAAAQRANPRELRALGDSLARLPEVTRAMAAVHPGGELAAIVTSWDDAAEIRDDIIRTLVERPPVVLGDGETIARGVSPELDDLRAVATGGREAIAHLQQAERERTGIASLKVGHNRVFGYYIEVTNANAHLVPADYQRRQTLAGAERYVTPALKEFEEKVLHATERIEALERDQFGAVRARAGEAIVRLQAIARRVAVVDVTASLAEVAARNRYVRPDMHDGPELEVTGGRHPVVEQMMPREQFIPNDIVLTPDARMAILTGPNMAGKSTILRQVGLLALLAHIGSFVPASRARVGLMDRIFTRVGASDNLVRGQSTFMVEMSETSAILNTATARSLVLLDEIGRGTSTWDGVSIAWAVSEYLHNQVGAKTIFATHYHELTQLADELPGVRNFNVAVEERGGGIRFLHRLRPGGADRSYGIEVGRLAGLPDAVLRRARALLAILEREQLAVALAGGAVRRSSGSTESQLALFGATPEHPVVERLRTVDVNRVTPIEAIALLADLVADARREQPSAAPVDSRDPS
ncbi:MAG TPA: DNA mismatch repair protein MutS [Gemmatimonadaceae bacterium]|nr:DNA mismatch repair protein MutS [Gemmatimonadaceae bacterium]